MLDPDSNTIPERIRNQNASGPGSVADPGCLSRIPIFTHPESRIQKKQQERGEKKFVVIPFFVAANFTKLKIILFLKC
jgi:hypothetical protein